MNLKFGRVVWVNETRGFGFVKPDREDIEIFLYFGDCRALEVTNGEITFSKLDVLYNLLPPRIGQAVCFLVTKGSKGRPKCSPWSYASKFKVVDDCLKQQKLQDANAFEFEECPECGHLMYHHNGGVSPCQVDGCHCGDQDYEGEDEVYRHEVRLSDSSMGTTIYE